MYKPDYSPPLYPIQLPEYALRVSGPMRSGKTSALYAIILDQLRAGRSVAVIGRSFDFDTLQFFIEKELLRNFGELHYVDQQLEGCPHVDTIVFLVEVGYNDGQLATWYPVRKELQDYICSLDKATFPIEEWPDLPFVAYSVTT